MKRSNAVLAACCTLSLLMGPAVIAAADTAWLDKIDPGVLAAAARGEKPEALVLLTEQADLSPAGKAIGQAAKGQAVFAALSAVAERTQAPLLADLRAAGVEHRSFWIENMIWVRAAAPVLEQLAKRPTVRRIEANPRLRADLPEPRLETPVTKAATAVEWGVARIGAPQAWSEGIDGSGVVIGGQDTGYDWSHPALRANYRGFNGATAQHDYNWHDAIHSASGNPCGVDAQAPCDDGTHGTHTMGTMVGHDGANQIGVAPGARWIGCRNMDRGVGTPATYAECFQWFLAPTNLAGGQPDPRRAPQVINNSWGCPASEGCTDKNVLKNIVERVRAAGIVVVVSAGNSGPRCGTVSEPAAIYDAAFSVGATDSIDGIASFSSRGPVTADGSQRPKPDVAAPGVSIRSSVPGGYGESSGTSMAGPHVAGLVALLLSAHPELDGNVDAIERAIRDSAVPLSTSEECGGTAGLVPNNTFGAGRVDAPTAIHSDPGSSFSDDFDDGVRSAGWKFRGGSWQERDGALTATGGEAWAQRAFAGCATCTVEATLAVAAGRGGYAALVGWRRDAKRYVELRLLEKEDRVVLVQRDSGRTQQASAALAIAAGTAYAARIAFDGSRFTVSVDGTPLLGLDKLAGSAPQGTVGFRVSGRAAFFDRIAAQ